ncbi:MAG: CoA pyrophosphatase [Alphaproteobacteria bacterium]|nr:CoA pyrophosphatase [Alphaproteobacteria bacterium]
MDALASPAHLRRLLRTRLTRLDAPDDAAAPFASDPGASPLASARRPAAVLICLRERPEGPSVILTRRAEGLREHTGQVALPGGRVEPGEAPAMTAVREAEEEVGLPRTAVELIGLATPYRTITAYHVTPVVGLAPADLPLHPNPGEVAEIFEAPFQVLMDLDRWERREAVGPSGETRRYYAMEFEGRLIWGATAGMLRALSQRLFGGPAEETP